MKLSPKRAETNFHAVRGHKAELNDMLLAKTIGDHLEAAYPMWGWMVHVDSENGIVNVICARLLPLNFQTYGYTLKMADLHDPTIIRKKAIQAGGELLERAGARRGPWSPDIELTHMDISPGR